MQGVVLKLPLKGSPSSTGVLDHALSRVEMITEVCSLPQILKSPLGLQVPPLELLRRLQHDRHDSGFYKCLFQNMRVPSELTWGWGGYSVPVRACQLVEVFETGLKLLYLRLPQPQKFAPILSKP